MVFLFLSKLARILDALKQVGQRTHFTISFDRTMPLNGHERLGASDLLTEAQNVPVLMQLARSVTKNVCDIESTQEALDYIYVHVGDGQTLLNKRNITKEILFKYLHNRNVAVKSDFTKGTLVTKVLQYWQSLNINALDTIENSIKDSRRNDASSNIQTIGATTISLEEQYPIHLLARQFAQWFFENYNDNTLRLVDFWSDARLHLRIAANDRVDDRECCGAEAVMDSLMASKLQFGFYFNPNVTHAGVQGRMNAHGLVLALVCGTLHTQDNCVGVFECTFGLLRDPFSENNWKAKTIQCMLRSEGSPHLPSLCDSDTLKDALTLPAPSGELA